MVITWRRPAPRAAAAGWGPLCSSRCPAQAPHGALSWASCSPAAEGLSYMPMHGTAAAFAVADGPCRQRRTAKSPSMPVHDRSELGIDWDAWSRDMLPQCCMHSDRRHAFQWVGVLYM